MRDCVSTGRDVDGGVSGIHRQASEAAEPGRAESSHSIPAGTHKKSYPSTQNVPKCSLCIIPEAEVITDEHYYQHDFNKFGFLTCHLLTGFLFDSVGLFVEFDMNEKSPLSNCSSCLLECTHCSYSWLCATAAAAPAVVKIVQTE